MFAFLPKETVPYFIWSPPWNDNSSGVRALHLLCHILNINGEKAYLTGDNRDIAFNPFWDTSGLTVETMNYFRNKEFIAVYPDIVRGNPMQAPRVVRWLLAPAGLYGGDKEFAETDKIFGYTSDIHPKTLCLPTVDTRIYKDYGFPRGGDCFYSHKYDKIHGNKLLPLTNDMTRCEGTPQQIAKILSCSHNCYIYERSEILQTAAICGCGVRPIMTDYWDGKLPRNLFTDDGVPVSQESLWRDFWPQLAKFREETQAWS